MELLCNRVSCCEGFQVLDPQIIGHKVLKPIGMHHDFDFDFLFSLQIMVQV